MSILEKKLNKGEWAEFYVMLKLLGEGKLYTANSLLEKDTQSFLEVKRVIRQELDKQVLDYIVDNDNSVVLIQERDSSHVIISVPCDDFLKNARKLFEGIKSLKGSSVSAPEDVCRFAEFIYVDKPKAPAVKAYKKQFGGKNDIFIEVRDAKTSIQSIMGFSIKSKFGQNPTLFNAGSSSQFLYKLDGCTEEMMEEFNAIRDGDKRGWSLCRQYILDKGIGLEFVRPQNHTYEINLLLVRDSMSKILAWCAKDRLIESTEKHYVKETVERLCALNPLGIPNPDVYYEKAMKDFLMAGFTGMTAGKPWDGKEQVNGGYIVVMDDGDVICYHSNDRESFRDYLYRNTFFEYVSTDKYEWSFIKKINGEFYLPLNVSVRFNKHTR